MGGKVSRTVFTSGGVGPDCQTDPEKVTVHLRKGCPGYATGMQLLTLCWAWPNPAKNSSTLLEGRDGLCVWSTQKAPCLSYQLHLYHKETLEAEVNCLNQGESFAQKGAGGFGEQQNMNSHKNRRGKRQEIMNKAETIKSFSPSKLQDTHKYYSHQPGELIIRWLLQCCSTGANSQELESREAQQLGSLTGEWGINKRIGKGAKISSRWRQLVLSVKKYPLEDGLVNS